MRQQLFMIAAAADSLSAGLHFWLLSVVFTNGVSERHHSLLGCVAPGHGDSEISPSSMSKDCMELITTLVWPLRQWKSGLGDRGWILNWFCPTNPMLFLLKWHQQPFWHRELPDFYFFTSVAARLLAECVCCCCSDWRAQTSLSHTEDDTQTDSCKTGSQPRCIINCGLWC